MSSPVRLLPSAAPLTGSELFYAVQNNTDVKVTGTQIQSLTSIFPGISPIVGGTSQCVLFDKAGVVGEDANFKWNYTSHTLNLPFAQSVAGAGSFNGFFVKITGDTQQRIFFGTDGSSNDSGYCVFGSGSAIDTAIYREAAGVLELVNYANFAAPTGIHIYNTIDNAGNAGPPTNYERAVFDLTTTSNVLTIGTQKGGSGSNRNIQFVRGGTNIGDYGITTGDQWQFYGAAGFGEVNSNFFLADALGANTGVGFFVTSRTISDSTAKIFLALDSANAGPYLGLSSSQVGAPGQTLLNNQATGVFGIQNATKTLPAALWVYNTSDNLTTPPSANYERAIFDWTITSNVLTIGTQAGGTGSSRAVQFIGLDFVHGASVSTSATDGFLYIPSCAGTPTGVPTTYTGTVPMVYDRTNNKFYIYNGGWKGGTNPGTFT